MIRLINEWLYKILDANLNVADGVILYSKRYAKSEVFLCHCFFTEQQQLSII